MYVLISVTNKMQEGSYATHDNVNKFDTFFALMAIGVGNSPVTSEFPAQGQWRGASMFSLICAWINVWVNNGETADLRRQRAHYDVTVIITASLICYTHTYHVQLCSLSTQHVACWEKNVILLYTLMSISICNSVIAQRLLCQKFWLLDFNERYGNIYIGPKIVCLCNILLHCIFIPLVSNTKCARTKIHYQFPFCNMCVLILRAVLVVPRMKERYEQNRWCPISLQYLCRAAAGLILIWFQCSWH